MSEGPLPHIIDFRALAARGARVQGHLTPDKLHRLSAAICDGSPAQVVARFDRDEMGRFVCDLAVEMPVRVACQRCLEPMAVTLAAESRIAALWSEDQAAGLPPEVDPVVTEEDTDLWLVVEEELLLVLPPYPLHDDPNCGAAVGRSHSSAEDAEPVDTGPRRDNPFAVLAALRDGDTSKDG